MARPRTHDETTAETLLDAAAGLLRAGGPREVSVRAVAEASGTSFRAVYALFGSKQALIDSLAERGYRSLALRVGSLPVTDDAVRDLVCAGANGFRRFAVDDPEIFRLTFERVSPEVLRQRAVGVAARAAYDALGAWVERARVAGAVHPDRSDGVCIMTFHSTCQGLAATEIASQPPPAGTGMWALARQLDLDAVWRDTLTALVHGFGEPPSARQ